MSELETSLDAILLAPINDVDLAALSLDLDFSRLAFAPDVLGPFEGGPSLEQLFNIAGLPLSHKEVAHCLGMQLEELYTWCDADPAAAAILDIARGVARERLLAIVRAGRRWPLQGKHGGRGVSWLFRPCDGDRAARRQSSAV